MWLTIATIGEVSHPSGIAVADGKIVAAFWLGTKVPHDSTPFRSVGSDTGSISVPGNQMSNFMGNSLLHECTGVVIQEFLIVANQGIAPWPEDHHAGGFAFEVEADLRITYGNPIALACACNQRQGSLPNLLLKCQAIHASAA